MSDSTRSSLSSSSARSRQTSSKLSTISSSSRSVAPRSYPRGLRASLTCRISTGVSAISPPPFSIQSVEDRLDQPLEEDKAEDRDDRRQVQGAEGRQDATEQTQIGLADVLGSASLFALAEPDSALPLRRLRALSASVPSHPAALRPPGPVADHRDLQPHLPRAADPGDPRPTELRKEVEKWH